MSISKRNKWTYSIGGIGRDMVFILVSMFTLAYIQYTMKLTVLQFSAISGIMIFARIWDGINDPMMGVIIENSHFTSGKFRPWILIGGLSNFVATILLFTVRPSGWVFVVFFAVVYISWGMTFTINDIAYWSLLPNLAKGNDERNSLTNLVLVFASIGQFLAGGLIPVVVTGNAVMMYRVVGVLVSFSFLGFTLLTYFGVKENEHLPNKEKVTIKEMFKILTQNDQLMIMTFALLLHTIASELFVAFALNFFYLEFGYEGNLLTIFTVIFGLGTLISLGSFSILTKRFKRQRIMTFGTVIVSVGYLLFFITGVILPMSLPLIFVSGFMVFYGIGLFYVTMIVMTANTIEYNELKTGNRNESIIFSVRPLMTKIGAAIQQGVVTGVLILSGVLGISSKIAELEIDKGLGLIDDITLQANAFLEEGTFGMKIMIRLGMAIVPLICILIAYTMIKKKYKIDEKYYEFMLEELHKKNA